MHFLLGKSHSWHCHVRRMAHNSSLGFDTHEGLQGTEINFPNNSLRLVKISISSWFRETCNKCGFKNKSFDMFFYSFTALNLKLNLSKFFVIDVSFSFGFNKLWRHFHKIKCLGKRASIKLFSLNFSFSICSLAKNN